MGIRIRVLFQEICQQAIYGEQIELDGHTRTSSLPGESSCSKSVNQNAARSYVNPDGGKWRTKWFRNLTPKELAYKCSILPERSSRSDGRFITKYATIEDQKSFWLEM